MGGILVYIIRLWLPMKGLMVGLKRKDGTGRLTISLSMQTFIKIIRINNIPKSAQLTILSD